MLTELWRRASWGPDFRALSPAVRYAVTAVVLATTLLPVRYFSRVLAGWGDERRYLHGMLVGVAIAVTFTVLMRLLLRAAVRVSKRCQ